MNQASLNQFAHIPRNVKIQGRMVIVRVGLWLAAVFCFVIVPVLGWNTMKRLRTLESSGIVIPSNVIDRHAGRGRSSSSTMTVSFVSNGRQVTEKRNVDFLVAKQYWFSSTVPVTIMPDNPDDWELGPINDKVISQEMHVWVVLDGLLSFIVCFFLVWIEIATFLERKLVRNGTAVAGIVLSSKLTGKQGTRVKYSFQTLRGNFERTSYHQGDAVSDYPPGTGLVVFYLNDHNPSAVPYGFFSYVELA